MYMHTQLPKCFGWTDSISNVRDFAPASARSQRAYCKQAERAERGSVQNRRFGGFTKRVRHNNSFCLVYAKATDSSSSGVESDTLLCTKTSTRMDRQALPRRLLRNMFVL